MFTTYAARSPEEQSPEAPRLPAQSTRTHPAENATMRQLSAFAVDLRQALAERDAALHEAAEAERARQRLFRDVPRQFRMPLRAMQALASSVEGRTEPTQAGAVATLRRLTEHLLGLLDTVTARAQAPTAAAADMPPQGPHTSSVDLERELAVLAGRHEPAARAKGLRLVSKTRGARVAAGWAIDAEFLARLIDPLLDNAVRHTHEGEIRLVLQFSKRGSTRIHVIDAGRGARPSDFAPLRGDSAEGFDAEPPRGIGLFRVAALADQLGCRVEAYRTPAGGTRISVGLPRPLDVPADDSAAADDSDHGVFDSGTQLVRLKKNVYELTRAQERSREELQQIQLDGLTRLVAAAELKDDDTGVHIVRMGWFSALIARALGQNTRYCETLLVASRMHDVGKIGVPDSILQKPGPLMPDEWSVMRRHPEIGAALLRGTQIPLYDMAADVALCHHEKFDGSGYPNGLAGDAIPLAARIVALADFFDAVTMDRCYRRAMSDERAFELIREGSGTHFDPMVVEAFFRAVPDLLDTRQRVNSGAPVAL